MSNKIISYGSLAKKLKPEIEEELGKQVKEHAIVMALRRYEEKLREKHKTVPIEYSSEIVLKTDICDISVLRSPTLFDRLKKLYDIVNFDSGGFINIIHGMTEVSILTNERYREKTLELLKNEKVINKEKNLVSLTFTFSESYFYAPGVVYNILRNLAWENINIFEIVSTNPELTIILAKKDAIKAYKSLEKLMSSN
jgi:hypothetical protein